MTRIIKERNEAGQLPEDLAKYANTKAKDFPTIRSAMMARPGWCIVEADYKTAEMRGLAYISGDAGLIKIIEEPDDCFALPKPECIPDNIDAEDCVVRIKFPEYIKSPDDRDKYLMTYSANGRIKATFTEDQLQKNADGKFISPGFDMHWGVLELARGHVREELDKKKDRGAGKVVNFCLAADTKVLTDSGYKLIHNITKKDLLWDGRGWCRHSGVKYRNKMLCIRRGNLSCTPDHIVYEYTDQDTIRPVCAIDACADKFINIAVMMDTDNKPVPDTINKSVEPITPEVLARRQWLRDGYNMVNESRPESELTDSEVQHIKEYANLIAEEANANGCSYISAYDIIDVGEYNRFYTDGGLVHNSSSYGGQAASLQRKIEADTGNKPELDDVQAMLDAIERRQPRATQFFKELEAVPTEKGYIRAASGRLRHCHTLSSGIKGLSFRTREGQITALGRECRNFP